MHVDPVCTSGRIDCPCMWTPFHFLIDMLEKLNNTHSELKIETFISIKYRKKKLFSFFNYFSI